MLTNFQEEVLSNVLKYSSITDFDKSYNYQDDELILHITNNVCVKTLIIYTDESFAYSYINRVDGHKLIFYDIDSDFKSIVYDFLHD